MNLFSIKNAVIIVFIILNTIIAKDETNLIGSPAPYWGLKTSKGKWEYLDNYTAPMKQTINRERKVVVMSFFASWCAPCMKEINVLQDLKKKYKDMPVEFFLVNLTEYFRNRSGAPNQHAKALNALQKLKDMGLNKITILEDSNGKTARRYGVSDKLPRLFVIDKFETVHLDETGLCDKCLNEELVPLIDKLVDE